MRWLSRLYLELAKTSVFAAVLLTPIAATGMIRADNPAPPSVRILNAGNESTIFAGSEAYVELESSATDEFSGTLEITLEQTADPQWQAVNVTEVSRALVELSLSTNETRRHEIIMPTVHSFSFREDLSALVWRLYTPRGRLLSTGREPILLRKEAPWRPDSFRALFITRASVETTYRIGIERAYSRSGRYAPFSHIVISIKDFADLTSSQQQAILDATGLGTILVLSDPAHDSPDGKEPLNDYGELIWRSGSGRDLYEVRQGLGMVRRVNLTADKLAVGRDALQQLVFAKRTLQTLVTPFENPTLSPNINVTWLLEPENHVMREEAWARRVQARQIVSWVVVLVFLLWASWRLHRLTTNRSLVRSSAGLEFCVSTIAVASLVQFVLANFAAGNIEQNITVTYNSHEPSNTLVLTRRVTGGGGGRADPWIEIPQADRTQFLSSPRRNFASIGKTRYASSLPPRVEPNYAHSSPSKALACNTRSALDSRRYWDAQIEWRDGEGLSGRLEALDSLQQAVILSNSRAARLGNVESGTALDVAEVSRALDRESTSNLTSSEYTMVRDAYEALWEMRAWKLGHSAWADDLAIIGLSKPVYRSNSGEGQHIAIQALRVALGEGSGTRLRRTAIPWSVADATTFEIWVPDILAKNLSASQQKYIASISGPPDWVNDQLCAAWKARTGERGSPEPDEHLDGFAKYTLPLKFDWTWEQKTGFLFLVWDQAGEK